jgi:hypothetical protein
VTGRALAGDNECGQGDAGEALTYQWLHDGTSIPGATSPMLNLGGMNMANAGQYTVMARNSVGTVAMSSVAVSMFSMELTNSAPHLVVAAPVGINFRIDYSDEMGGGTNWQAMTNFTVMGSLSRITDTPPPGSHPRFYRAVMLP